MTVTEPDLGVDTGQPKQQSLGTAAARNLATTTKSVPQMQGISPRWLLRMLPWVDVPGGSYRVNRRLSYAVGDGRVTFTNTGSDIRVIPQELRELPALRDFEDAEDNEILNGIADRFRQQEFAPGDVIAEFGHQADQVLLIAHGKVNKLGTGQYGDLTVLGVLADGDHLGNQVLLEPDGIWEFTVKAVTPCTVLSLSRSEVDALLDRSESLRAHLERVAANPKKAQNKHGEAAIDLASGHEGEAELPSTFVDYEQSPREYQLSVAQTVLRVHSRVADLYNQPMNQTEQQLRLTVEALRERQEHEMINNREFGLLHNADLKQRIHTRTGPPTPDDLDELLSRRRKTELFLAHPRTIAAFGRECNKRGIYPEGKQLDGKPVHAWRGVPFLPSNKFPISDGGTSSILAMRTGEDAHGVVGLHQTGLPEEYEPGLSVRFTGVNDQGIISYLVSAYFSVAVLVPDALGVLENVEITR
ncbi:family 2B encapsulin nanocompartment shell protein [Amycolatopsis albispora]|uniref:Crp/Fnr family transcriptional regulator n=1 Tax=Amycolatopsis albispora TaxID=1804986 RepID=A0A344L4Y3_9PSEU|nr:family 2B encapsulin nanocompartment shell protein [Amycolatopsis albispora]AXB43107.1 Crp/Fnr family transcriptional regulator [Amycolatopsis albispora]